MGHLGRQCCISLETVFSLKYLLFAWWFVWICVICRPKGLSEAVHSILSTHTGASFVVCASLCNFLSVIIIFSKTNVCRNHMCLSCLFGVQFWRFYQCFGSPDPSSESWLLVWGCSFAFVISMHLIRYADCWYVLDKYVLDLDGGRWGYQENLCI